MSNTMYKQFIDWMAKQLVTSSMEEVYDHINKMSNVMVVAAIMSFLESDDNV